MFKSHDTENNIGERNNNSENNNYNSIRHYNFCYNTNLLPVVFFIHDSHHGDITGSGNTYDGNEMAAYARTIVVTMNHRSGLFGSIILYYLLIFCMSHCVCLFCFVFVCKFFFVFYSIVYFIALAQTCVFMCFYFTNDFVSLCVVMCQYDHI